MKQIYWTTISQFYGDEPSASKTHLTKDGNQSIKKGDAKTICGTKIKGCYLLEGYSRGICKKCLKKANISKKEFLNLELISIT